MPPCSGHDRRNSPAVAGVTICCEHAAFARLASPFVHSTVAFTLHREPMEQVAMRCLAAHVMLTAAILSVRFASASEQNGGELSLTLRIHDYSSVPSDSLSRATALVTRMY
jgi:hypothetical protein